MGTQPPPQRSTVPPPIFGPCLFLPNGWLDQDATCYGGISRPIGHNVTMCYVGTQLPSPKRGHSPLIFGPCLLWPNGCMDQDATLYGGRPRPRPHCARREPSPLFSKKEAQPPFSAHVCCGQTPGWIKMSLGAKVGLGPGHIVLHGGAAHPERVTAPQFSADVYCGQTVGHLSYC